MMRFSVRMNGEGMVFHGDEKEFSELSVMVEEEIRREFGDSALEVESFETLNELDRQLKYVDIGYESQEGRGFIQRTGESAEGNTGIMADEAMRKVLRKYQSSVLAPSENY